MTKRVVVIGAGPGGLASAMLLARAGCRVTVLERLPRVGGRTSSLEARGFRFDLGPTFFLYPRVLREIFRACGLSLDEAVELRRLDPQYQIAFGQGGVLDCSPDVGRMQAALAGFNASDAQQLPRFLSDNRRKLEAFRPCLERPFLGWRDVLSPRLLKLLPMIRPWRSVDTDLRRYFSDERVRLAFSFQSKYLGMSPFNCPSLFTILSFLEYENGVWHPMGGCGAVSEAMAEAARSLGVEIRLSEAATSIDFDGRRARAVHTADATYPCDALVVNADFARAMQRLVPDELRRRWSDRKIAKKRFSCSTFMLYLGIEGQIEGLPHHTIHIAQDYARNLREIEDEHVLSEDPSFYVQNACVTDPGLAPEGHSTLYVLVPVTHRHPNVDWSRDAAPFRRRVLRQLSKIGIRDVEHRIRYERMITPEDWDTSYEIHQGATFNLAHNLRQMLHLRPRNRMADLDAVYLTGGGTHPGSGLPVIYESARVTSRLVCEDLGLSYPELCDTPSHGDTPSEAHEAPPGHLIASA
jgi:phytoene desaturase